MVTADIYREGGMYGKLTGSLENVKQKVERNDCSDVGGEERKRGPRILESVRVRKDLIQTEHVTVTFNWLLGEGDSG